MTCIIGVKHKGSVWMGCDALGFDQQQAIILKGVKIVKYKNYIFGNCGDIKLITIIPHKLNIDAAPKRNLSSFIYNKVIPSLQDILIKHYNDNSFPTTMLIGVNGKIFRIDANKQCFEFKEEYIAIGSGSSFANGSLFSTKNNKEPRKRIEIALSAAEKHHIEVRRPWTIIKT